MKKAAAKDSTTIEESATQYMEALEAKSRFLSATLGMGWRLAITVVVPIIAGVKLDERFNTSPSLTLTGFMLAVAAASVVVWRTIKQVNADQVEIDAKKQSDEANKTDKTDSSSSNGGASSGKSGDEPAHKEETTEDTSVSETLVPQESIV